MLFYLWIIENEVLNFISKINEWLDDLNEQIVKNLLKYPNIPPTHFV